MSRNLAIVTIEQRGGTGSKEKLAGYSENSEKPANSRQSRVPGDNRRGRSYAILRKVYLRNALASGCLSRESLWAKSFFGFFQSVDSQMTAVPSRLPVKI